MVGWVCRGVQSCWDGWRGLQRGAELYCPGEGCPLYITFSKTCKTQKIRGTAIGDKHARQSQIYFCSPNPRVSQADAGEHGSKAGWESHMATTCCCHELQS